jgi:hypothetical protein
MGSGQGPGQSVLEIVLDAADMRSAVGRRSHVVNSDDDDGKSSMVDDHAQRAPTGQAGDRSPSCRTRPDVHKTRLTTSGMCREVCARFM